MSSTAAEYKADVPVADALTSETLDSELSPNSAVMESFASVQEADNSLEFDLGVVESEPAKVAESSPAEELVVAEINDAAASADENILEFTMSSDDSPALTIAEPVSAEL